VYKFWYFVLTLILLMWRLWWAPNNASRWRMGFKSEFKGLKKAPCRLDENFCAWQSHRPRLFGWPIAILRRFYCLIYETRLTVGRCQWPRVLRRRSAAARLLKLWVQIPSEAWMCVCCECCVLSDGGLWDKAIIRPEESYRLWCVVVCDLETSWMRRPSPLGAVAPK